MFIAELFGTGQAEVWTDDYATRYVAGAITMEYPVDHANGTVVITSPTDGQPLVKVSPL